MNEITKSFLIYLRDTGKLYALRKYLKENFECLQDASMIEPEIVTYIVGIVEFKLNSDINMIEIASDIFAKLEDEHGNGI
jgi:hypothetical protein